MEGNVLQQVIYWAGENTVEINLASFNKLLTTLYDTYDDSERYSTTSHEICCLCLKNHLFLMYLADIKCVIRDLN